MIAVRTHTVAKTAYERVHTHRSDPKKKEYGALAHKLPGMILENGLAQATGFLLAKGKPEHRALLDDLNAVLRSARILTTADGPALHREVIESDLHRTLVLTRRSLEASGWIKRYVQGVLRVGATGDPESTEDETDGSA